MPLPWEISPLVWISGGKSSTRPFSRSRQGGGGAGCDTPSLSISGSRPSSPLLSTTLRLLPPTPTAPTVLPSLRPDAPSSPASARSARSTTPRTSEPAPSPPEENLLGRPRLLLLLPSRPPARLSRRLPYQLGGSCCSWGREGTTWVYS